MSSPNAESYPPKFQPRENTPFHTHDFKCQFCVRMRNLAHPASVPIDAGKNTRARHKASHHHLSLPACRMSLNAPKHFRGLSTLISSRQLWLYRSKHKQHAARIINMATKASYSALQQPIHPAALLRPSGRHDGAVAWSIGLEASVGVVASHRATACNVCT